MRRSIVFATVALALCAHTSLWAQVRPVVPPRRDSARARPDTLRRDSTAADSTKPKDLIKWNEPDSVMRALMDRAGYTATRYQGDVAVFNAQTHTLELKGKKAGVNRDKTVIVGDSIIYNDSTKIMFARGDTVILRDPEQQPDDVYARGLMAYNIELHRGVVTNITTAIEQTGQHWIVYGKDATFVSDTSRGRETAFYVRNGTITSCDDSIPDYHFRANEIKMISKNIMVARPAVLYIGDVPIMWLPFIFQDIRSGRRSGVITPRFGVSELFRNSPTYRRHLDNLGYYFAINDYMDAQVALDWRSGARPTTGDPGWVQLNGEMNYRWLDRFVSGSLGLSQHDQRDGTKNTSVSWSHSQAFSQTSHLTANINYVTNTMVQRTTAFNPAAVLANISSSATYDRKIGPAMLSVGGTRTQHPGRTEVGQNFPNLSLSMPTVSPVSWFEWSSPMLTFNTDQIINSDAGSEFPFRYITGTNGLRDSVRRVNNSRTTSSTFNTPIRIAGFTWSNSFTLVDKDNDALQTVVVHDVNDSSNNATRVFARRFSTTLDWSTGISLPSFLQNSLKVSPSVSFGNVDGNPFWVRTELSGGKFVHQTKRPYAGLTASPTLFALFPGFGAVTRFRHSITPILNYTYAPSADISDEYLSALNKTRQGYLGAIAQNRVSLSLATVLEAKLRSTDTSSSAEPKKIKILSVNITPPLAYDFERARQTHRSGFATDNITSDFATDLIPGFHGSVRYSLYQGDITSDSARFKPFREGIDAGFSINSQSGIFGALSRLFGRAGPAPNAQTEASPDVAVNNRAANAPVAGITSRNRQYDIPDSQGWSATLTYGWSRQRPPTGNGVIVDNDPTVRCAPALANPILYAQCIEQESANPTGVVQPPSLTGGGPFYRQPGRNNLDGNLNFHLTPMWAGSWHTNYDFQAKKFGSHQVTLQRVLHDWKAIFAFTQAPNGNFAFNFFIALTAEPDLKFNYDKSTYRPVTP